MADDTPVSENTTTETTEIVKPPSSGEAQTETTEKRPSRAKERIQVLASDRRAAIEMAEFQRQRADDLQVQLNGQQTITTEPDIANYDDATKWQKDFTKFAKSEATRIATEAVDKGLKDHSAQRTIEQNSVAFEASMSEAAEKHDDYFDVVYDENTFLPVDLLSTVKELPNAGEMVYYLGKHPAEARKLAAMSTTARAAELGVLGASMTDTKPKPQPNLTNAPDPPTEISGAAKTEVDLSKVSTTDYMRIRREQLKQRRGY